MHTVQGGVHTVQDGALLGLCGGVVDFADRAGCEAVEALGARVIARAEDHELAGCGLLDDVVDQLGAGDRRCPGSGTADEVVSLLDAATDHRHTSGSQRDAPRG